MIISVFNEGKSGWLSLWNEGYRQDNEAWGLNQIVSGYLKNNLQV